MEKIKYYFENFNPHYYLYSVSHTHRHTHTQHKTMLKTRIFLLYMSYIVHGPLI